MRLSFVHFSFALAFIGIGGSLQGCQSGNTDASHIALGTETNWLEACNRDQDCGELSCECGVCTQRCDEDRSCNLHDAVCSTASSPALIALCSSPSAGIALCLPACNESCGVGQVCVDNACIPAKDSDAATGSSSNAEPNTSSQTALPSNPQDSSNASPSSIGSTVSNLDSGPSTPTAETTTGTAADASSTVTSNTYADAGGNCSADSQGACGTDCDYDSCHPERCDEVGELCCDPLPSDGPNYCNSGLECLDGACRERAGTTTPEALERESCESTGGDWIATSCGHYVCGQPPVCAAIIPGCNCGPGRSFGSMGCWDQPDCPSP